MQVIGVLLWFTCIICTNNNNNKNDMPKTWYIWVIYHYTFHLLTNIQNKRKTFLANTNTKVMEAQTVKKATIFSVWFLGKMIHIGVLQPVFSFRFPNFNLSC